MLTRRTNQTDAMNFRNYFFRAGLIAGSIAGLMPIYTVPASAQAGQAVGVLERERPAYDAKGIPLGGFRLYPQLNFDTAHDDNVFRLPAGQSDWYFRET